MKDLVPKFVGTVYLLKTSIFSASFGPSNHFLLIWFRPSNHFSPTTMTKNEQKRGETSNFGGCCGCGGCGGYGGCSGCGGSGGFVVLLVVVVLAVVEVL